MLAQDFRVSDAGKMTGQSVVATTTDKGSISTVRGEALSAILLRYLIFAMTVMLISRRVRFVSPIPRREIFTARNFCIGA
jgi:hypothetical protein